MPKQAAAQAGRSPWARLWQGKHGLVLQALAFLPLLALLIYLTLRHVDFSALGSSLQATNWGWVAAALTVSLASHVVRAWRWQGQINQLHVHITLWDAFYAVVLGYNANMLVPRGGELLRCALVARQKHLSFDRTFGTLMAERIFDFLMFLLLTLVAVGLSLTSFGGFLWHEVLHPFLTSLATSTWIGLSLALLAVILGSIGFYWALVSNLLGRRLKIRTLRAMRGFTQGFNTMLRAQHPWGLLFQTVLLWLLYWLATHLFCLALPATAHLTPRTSFTLLVVGTFGILIPVQGGIGAYHYAVMLWLLVVGLSREDGLAYATLAHGAQAINLLIVFLLLMLIRRIAQRRLETKAPMQA